MFRVCKWRSWDVFRETERIRESNQRKRFGFSENTSPMLSKKEMSVACSLVRDKDEAILRNTQSVTVRETWIGLLRLCLAEVRCGLSMSLTISVRFAIRFRW